MAAKKKSKKTSKKTSKKKAKLAHEELLDSAREICPTRRPSRITGNRR